MTATRKRAGPLRPVRNPTREAAYCGPTVVAGITGRAISVVKEAIRLRHYAGKRVTGTSTSDVSFVLARFGYSMDREWIERDDSGKFPTMAQWAKARTDKGATYILNVSFGKSRERFQRIRCDGKGSETPIPRQEWNRGHWVVVRGHKFLDTYTSGQPVALKDAPHRRKKVTQAFRVERVVSP